MKARAAHKYGDLGWGVVPIHDFAAGACSCGDPKCLPEKSAGKHPRISEWQKKATRDAATIAAWWEMWPDANLGIATGAASGFFVLDVDPDNGGPATLDALIATYGALPATVQAQTGSGGTHYLFRMVPGLNLRNTAGKLGEGLDTRGDGGQIVVAPSVSGKGEYRWVRGPWKYEVLEAPPWLVEILSRTSSPAREPIPGLSNVDRGYFPAASPEVIEAAREALDLFGPAIEGGGGDGHTMQAAAILTHDFALTDDEAWPLFVEWNEECQPPWDLDGLREKLTNGRRYGKAEYGARRSADAVELAKKLVRDWKAAGAKDDALPQLVARCRHLCKISGDTVKHTLIKNELSDATGMNARELDLPAVASPSETPPEDAIVVTPEIHEVADKSIAAIAPDVFQRNGVLCQVVKVERTFIHDLQTNGIQDLMSKARKYVSRKEGEITAMSPPLQVAAILQARRTHPPEVRVLEAVTTAPVFLADGSILQARGYNAQARVFLEPSVEVEVEFEPTHAQAVEAVNTFRSLLSDFFFADPGDFSSWLAGLLSPLVKAATKNEPAPLICISAPSPGAGKSLLTEVIAAIVTGGKAEISPYSGAHRDPVEWNKRLTAFVKAASPVRVLDNCNGPIGDEGLDRLITSSTWSDRILGASEAPPMPNVTTWFATGNNIEPVGDTVRRVLMCRIEVDSERPQERSGFRHPELVEYALENRSQLLSAALTILRGFHCAGRPDQRLPSWGSFGAWSKLVRNALVWAGCVDPFVTQKRASLDLNEGENEAHDFWIGVIGATDGLCGSIVTTAQQRNAKIVLGLREDITAFTLKKFISRFIDKPRGGQRIRKGEDKIRKQIRYSVEPI